MNLQLVQFQTKDNIDLPGLFYTPNQKTDKVLIWLHGSFSSVFYSVNRMNIIANELTSRSISFFSFNNRGANQIKRLTHNRGKDNESKENYGTAYELIQECICDIEGAVEYLQKLGYQEFYLAGHSTGANKICVYNFHKPKNIFKKFVLVGGGDDTGLYFQQFGEKNFKKFLQLSEAKVAAGKGNKLAPNYILPFPYSYKSLFDVINPDGNFNIFPYHEYLNQLKLSRKKLFREFKSIEIPCLVVYGSEEIYCSTTPQTAISILKEVSNYKKNFIYKVVEGADHSFEEKSVELAETIGKFLNEKDNKSG